MQQSGKARNTEYRYEIANDKYYNLVGGWDKIGTIPRKNIHIK